MAMGAFVMAMAADNVVMVMYCTQIASSTLDAGAKIYAGRVDSIYNDIFKVLGGLGREHLGT